MVLVEKIKEAAISVLPIMAVVWLLHLFAAPLETGLARFLTGGVLLILGLALFLLGADLGIVPIGHRAGSALTQKRNLPLLLGAGFVIGFFITVAEPDVHVLSQQVASVDASIDPLLLVGMIAIGVGVFVAIALGRIVFQLSLRLLLAVFYAIVFICAAFTAPAFLGIAFDAGGATTGPMTVPFIMALGIGVAAVRAGQSGNDSFGLIGIASIGPILSILVLGILQKGGAITGGEAEAAEAAHSLWGHFWSFVPEVAAEVGMALLPLVGLFIIFRIFLLRRMTRYRMLRTSVGLIYTWLGLVLFFTGVKGGFIPAGTSLGASLATHDQTWLLLAIAFTLGALAVCAEPAVWVLTNQVETVSGGAIKSSVLLVFLCIGVAIAVSMALLRVAYSLSIWWFLLPGYLLAFLLTIWCPAMFTAIAFDSGGVASGPMASTFILAFTLGASHGMGGNPIMDAFGVIALIAMTPLIAIQLLGLIYSRKMARPQAKQGAKS